MQNINRWVEYHLVLAFLKTFSDEFIQLGFLLFFLHSKEEANNLDRSMNWKH